MKIFCVLLVVGLLVYAEGNSILQQDADEKEIDELDEKAISAAAAIAAVEAAKLVYNIAKEAIKFLWSLPATVSKPYWYMINFSLNGNGVWQSGRLQDGDYIKIMRKTRSPYTSENQVRFTLTQPSNTWWKALTVHTYENKFKYEVAYCQDSTHSNTNNLEYKEILENYLVLSKAKAFGAHTNVYWLQNSYDMGPQYQWEIEWQDD